MSDRRWHPKFLIWGVIGVMSAVAVLVCDRTQADRQEKQIKQKPTALEIVMTPDMTITATLPTGIITITAESALTRAYTWKGATRVNPMQTRVERWYGSLGIYSEGTAWKEHNGITEGLTQEGQQHFKSVEEAVKWLQSHKFPPLVYRDDGLAVGWYENTARKQLTVEVWQIVINGYKPQKLPGSQNAKIHIGTVQTANPPLITAVRGKNLNAVKTLLKQGADANTQDRVGTPVLLIAAQQGNVPLVQILLDSGAAPNRCDANGVTALLVAAEEGYVEVVKALLAKGADVNIAYPRGMTKGMNALILATVQGSARIVETLLENKADVEACDAMTGQTALHWAAEMKNMSLVELLLKHGANVDARDRFGRTPLMQAVTAQAEAVTQRLLAGGANPNARDDKTRIQYMAAEFVGDTATMKKLAANGNLDTLHEDGTSVLEYAKASGNQKIITMLTSAGVRKEDEGELSGAWRFDQH